MIKVACISCSTPYDLDEARIPSSGMKMRCPKCGSTFLVFADGRVETAPAAPPLTPRPGVGKPTLIGAAAAPSVPPPTKAPLAPPLVPRPRPMPGGVTPSTAPRARPSLPRESPAAGRLSTPPAMPLPVRPRIGSESGVTATGATTAAPGTPAVAPAPTSTRSAARSAFGPASSPAMAKPTGLDAPPQDPALATRTVEASGTEGGFDLEIDLTDAPAPAGSTGEFGDLDLPAPRAKAPAPAAAPGDLDLPAPRAKAPAPAAALGDLDLPAPRAKAPAATAALGDLDLPAPRAAAPARLGELDLDLPAPRAKAPAAPARLGELDLDLPAPRAAAPARLGELDLDLPTPRAEAARSGALADVGRTPFDDLDLPSSQAGTNLPTPRAVSRDVAAAPQAPARPLHEDAAEAFGDLELPMPRAAASGAGIDDLELPTPRLGALDLPPLGSPGAIPPADLDSGALPVPEMRESSPDFGSFAGPSIDADLPGLPAPRAAARGHGELDLRAGSSGDDMEFSDLPQSPAGKDPAPAGLPLKLSKPPAERTAPSAVPPRRSRAPWIAVGTLSALGIAGGALALTPLGPFGIVALEAYLPGAGDPAAIQQALARIDARMALGVLDEAVDAVRELASARHDAGLNRGLLARSLLHESLLQHWFGADSGGTARAAAIKHRLEERGLDRPDVALALAADALRAGDAGQAAGHLATARAFAPSDPFVSIVDGEVALVAGRPEDAAQAFRAAIEAGGGAAAQWGLARALRTLGDEAADAACDATLAASPHHAGARVAQAVRAWALGDEATALLRAGEVVGSAPVDGMTLHACETDRADAYELIGSIDERRGRTHHALEAYAQAMGLGGTRVRAILGAGRTLLDERPSDALAHFESVLQVADETAPGDGSRSLRQEAQFGAARAMSSLGRVQEAFASLETLATARPEDAEVMLWMGRIEQRMDHGEAAEGRYREAVRLAPTMFDAYLALAEYYVHAERASDAFLLMAEASQRVPESAPTRQQLGHFELSQGRMPEALQQLDRALAIDPRLPAAHFDRGVALRRSGQLEAAAEAFDLLASLDPAHPGLALERGLLYEARGQLDRSVAFYAEALAERPEDPELLLRLAGAQIATDQLDAADGTLAHVQRILTTSGEMEHLLGRAAFARGQLAAASTHFDRAVELDTSRGTYHLYSAWAHLELGNIGRAMDFVAAAIERDAGLADAYWIRGRLRLQVAQVRDAVRDLERALALKPERIEALPAIGECFDQLRDLPRAIDAYQRAVAARDTEGQWWYRLGRLQLDANARAEAARALTRATALGDAAAPSPGWLADAHRVLADALVLGGDRTGGVQQYQRYLEIAPPTAIDVPEVRRTLASLGAPVTDE